MANAHSFEQVHLLYVTTPANTVKLVGVFTTREIAQEAAAGSEFKNCLLFIDNWPVNKVDFTHSSAR